MKFADRGTGASHNLDVHLLGTHIFVVNERG